MGSSVAPGGTINSPLKAELFTGRPFVPYAAGRLVEKVWVKKFSQARQNSSHTGWCDRYRRRRHGHRPLVRPTSDVAETLSRKHVHKT